MVRGIVTWHGFTAPVEVKTAMPSAAAVVLPSRAEGVPRTLIEAAAAGAPIITTDTPGCRDTVIDRVSGFLCPLDAPAALAEPMAKLLDDPQLIAKPRWGRRAGGSRSPASIAGSSSSRLSRSTNSN